MNAGAITLRDKPNVSEEAREKPGKRGLGRKHGGFLTGVRHSMLKKHNLCTERIADCTPRFLRMVTDVYGMRHAVCAGGAGYYENFWEFLRDFERF